MSEQFDILLFIKYLWRKKMFIFLVAFIPAIITFIVCLFLPKKYQSGAVILTPEVSAGGGIIQTPFGGFTATGLGKSVIGSQAILAMLRSDLLAEGFVDQFKIEKTYRIKKRRLAVELVKKKLLRVDINEKEGVFNINTLGRSPEEAKEMVEFIIFYLNKINQEVRVTHENPLVKVVSPPYLPIKKTYPNTRKNVMMAGLSGLLIGLGYLYFTEKKDS